MSPDTVKFILQVAAIAVGGGSVQLGIFLLKRRSEIRKLDATSGKEALGSATTYINTLQAGEKAARDELARREVHITELETKRELEDRKSTQALTNAQIEIEQLAAELARARTNFAVAQNQINELSHQLTTRQVP